MNGKNSRFRILGLCLVVLALAWPQLAQAQDNDECEDCISVGEGSFQGTTADNTGSTGDDTSCTFSDEIDEWYCYTASCTGTATASLCESSYDTALSVFDGCGGAELACNDDACSLQSEVSWDVTGGETYNVRVSGFNNDTGEYALELSCEGVPVGPCAGQVDLLLDVFGCATLDTNDVIPDDCNEPGQSVRVRFWDPGQPWHALDATALHRFQCNDAICGDPEDIPDVQVPPGDYNLVVECCTDGDDPESTSECVCCASDSECDPDNDPNFQFIHLHVADEVRPIINDCSGCDAGVCVADISRGTDPQGNNPCPDGTIGNCGATVEVTPPDFDDACGASCAVKISGLVSSFADCSAASRFYPVGSWTLDWRITDVNGNVSECESSVHIEDTEKPTITCPDDIVEFILECSVDVPDLGQPTVADNCHVFLSVFNDAGDTTVYEAGWHQVEWIVIDASGNSCSCTQMIHVLKMDKPTIKCPDDICVNNDQGDCGAIVEVPLATGNDQCPPDGDADNLIITHIAIGPDGQRGPNRNRLQCGLDGHQCCLGEEDCDHGDPATCWDLNDNQACDMPGGDGSGEDIDGDGDCDADDCSMRCFNDPDGFGNAGGPGGCFDGPGNSCPPNSNNCDANASGFYPVGETTVTFTVFNPVTGLSEMCDLVIEVEDADKPKMGSFWQHQEQCGDSCGCDTENECPQHPFDFDFVETVDECAEVCKADIIEQVIGQELNCPFDPLHAPGPFWPSDNCEICDYEICSNGMWEGACTNGASCMSDNDCNGACDNIVCTGTEITGDTCLVLGVNWVDIRAIDCAEDLCDDEDGRDRPNASKPCAIELIVILGEDCNGNDGGETEGADGDDGINCWDTNQNGICDPGSEDTDGDTTCTVADCQGPQGEPGPSSGLSCWDLDANGERDCDANPDHVEGDPTSQPCVAGTGEDTNGDGFINVFDCHGTTGAAGPGGPAGPGGADGGQGPAGADGADGQDGIDGQDGDDGQDGADGQDGIDGQDGDDGQSGQANPTGMCGLGSLFGLSMVLMLSLMRWSMGSRRRRST